METMPVTPDLSSHLAEIVRASGAAITSAMMDRRIDSWSPGAETLFGFTTAEALGADCLLTVPPDRTEEALGILQRAESGEVLKIETVRRHKSGRLVDVAISLAPMRNPAGAVVGTCAVTHDISARKFTEERLAQEAAARERAEEAGHQAIEELARTRRDLEERDAQRSAELAAVSASARESAHRFETLVANSPLPIISLDLQGRVLHWNPASEQLFGWSEAEVLGRFPPYLPVENRAFYEAELRARLAKPERQQGETKRRRRDGSVLDIAFWRAPLRNAENEICGSMALLMDVTEQKFLERALLEATERESRRIGQELHDHLCQDLLGAAFSTKAVAIGLPANSPLGAELDTLARLINSAVQQARDVARGLNPVEMDSAGLMAALEELTTHPRPGMTCRLECERAVFLRDPKTALHAYRIAQEAVANAVKHSRGSEIVVRLRQDGKNVRLQISDNGRGFPQPAPTTAGLGLAIMRYRAHAIAGKLSIDAAANGGTSVSCTFPNTR